MSETPLLEAGHPDERHIAVEDRTETEPIQVAVRRLGNEAMTALVPAPRGEAPYQRFLDRTGYGNGAGTRGGDHAAPTRYR